jgi:hypothetical protein
MCFVELGSNARPLKPLRDSQPTQQRDPASALGHTALERLMLRKNLKLLRRLSGSLGISRACGGASGFLALRDDIAPQTNQPIVRLNRDSDERELALLRWGPVPFFDAPGFSSGP